MKIRSHSCFQTALDMRVGNGHTGYGRETADVDVLAKAMNEDEERMLKYKRIEEPGMFSTLPLP